MKEILLRIIKIATLFLIIIFISATLLWTFWLSVSKSLWYLFLLVIELPLLKFLSWYNERIT